MPDTPGSSHGSQSQSRFAPGRAAAGKPDEPIQQTLRDLRSTSRGVVMQGKQAATEVGAELKDQAKQVGDEVKSSLSSLARQGTERAGGYLGTAAQALHAAAEKLNEGDEAPIARFATGAASRLERAADYIANHDPASLASDLKDLARKRPELFIGGAVALGIIAGRFLKASGGGSGAGRSGGWDREHHSGLDRSYASAMPSMQGEAPSSPYGSPTSSSAEGDTPGMRSTGTVGGTSGGSRSEPTDGGID